MKMYYKYLKILVLNRNLDEFYYHFHIHLTYYNDNILSCCHSNTIVSPCICRILTSKDNCMSLHMCGPRLESVELSGTELSHLYSVID